MKSLSKRDMCLTRGGGTAPNENAAFQGQVAASWPGPDSPFPPPPGSFALFAELNGLSVKEIQEIIRENDL